MSNESVTDEIILEGFRSLAQAMAEGFDNARRDLNALETRMNQRFGQMDERFASSEQRMMRHFDKRDDRLDDHGRRITTLEAQR